MERVWVFFFFSLIVLQVEFWALHMLGKYSIAELYIPVPDQYRNNFSKFLRQRFTAGKWRIRVSLS